MTATKGRSQSDGQRRLSFTRRNIPGNENILNTLNKNNTGRNRLRIPGKNHPGGLPLRVKRMLQLGDYIRFGITGILEQHNFSRSLPNCHIIKIGFRMMGLDVIAVKNFFTASKNTHAVGCCLQGNHFEPIGPADRSAYLDNSSAGICTTQIIAIDITLRDRYYLPGVFGKRIKANSAPTRIGQYDAYVGRAIVFRMEYNVEFAKRKTVTTIIGIEFLKEVATARISRP
jgi:hypothetical protein